MMMQEPWFSIVALVARVLMAIVFLVSGIEKATNFARAIDEYEKDKVPFRHAAVVSTVVLHLAASVCLIAGWLVMEMAAALALFTLVATFIVHDFWNMQGNERLGRSRIALANVALAGGLLLLAVVGPGNLVL